MDDVLEVINLKSAMPNVLNLPLRPLPLIKKQNRKKQATQSMPEWSICGADTETVEGRVWLFSTEQGVWTIDTLGDLLITLYRPEHARKWKCGRGKKRKHSRGISTLNFFFWNLKFDVQAIMRLFDDFENGAEIVDGLIEGETVKVTVTPPGFDSIKVELRYLEGKHLTIRPLDWFIGQYKVGACYWWDISQFFGKSALQIAAMKHGLGGKIERCFDGSVLDVKRLDEKGYRDMYREDIEKYAVQDAVLAGELARIRCRGFVEQGIRFIRPYSIANVAQRNLLDTCNIPTIDDYTKSPALTSILLKGLTSYQGGWFETTGSGYLPSGTALDLASAYPYVMTHLPDTSAGYWVEGDDAESWWHWIDERQPYSLGFAEAFVVFDKGQDWYPLVKKSATGTLVAPRIIKGWFSADELSEARQWPHSTFVIGEWVRFVEDDAEARPFKPFIERHYRLKHESEKGSNAYQRAKDCQNSIYGKTIQAVDDIAGALYNPMYAAAICGGTRARLGELLRVNDFSAVSVATDGVIFETDKVHTVPDRPLPALLNLGQWEIEGEGELLVAMSGVYSLRTDLGVSTTFRGSASLFLRRYSHSKYCDCGDCPQGLFDFCTDNADLRSVVAKYHAPYSAREARVRGDFSLMNRFVPRTATLSALGDSTKRLWPRRFPSTFKDLQTEWWTSTPHEQIEEVSYLQVDT
jgi:hypothetical protein